jgi:periplasmic protein TonB
MRRGFPREEPRLSMAHTKTLITRGDQDFLPAPVAPSAHAPKQRRMMIVALVLLIVALGFVLYRDRDFWFPDTEEADQLEPVPVAKPAPKPAAQPVAQPSIAVTTKAATPAPTLAKKRHVSKPHLKAAGPAVAAAAPKASPTAATTAAAASAPPTTSAPPANVTRTVLPPLEVEVVAGDNHRTIRPGANSVHVDLQPGTAPRPVTSPAVVASAPATAASVTSNAAEKIQMSAAAAQVVGQPVTPAYPMLARQMKVQGSVILQALIGRDGLIQDLHVLSGPPILANAAQEAVRQWRFKPHYLGNEPVETQAKITVNFTISTN